MVGRSENPRFKGENILQLELDMPERTTRDYEVLPQFYMKREVN